MKKLFLRLTLFICGICVGQPIPPQLTKIPTPPQPKEYSKIQLSINYGIAETLGGERLYQHKKNIIGRILERRNVRCYSNGCVKTYMFYRYDNGCSISNKNQINLYENE